MRLTDQQCNEFFDAMDSLLRFVNKRFDVVPGFNMEVNTALDEAKAAIIAHALWDNEGVVGEFCAANPDHLPRRVLDQVKLWENAITGTFTLVRYQEGSAILMGEAGVFAVSGISVDMDEIIGPSPAHVEATLLPFAGIITYDGFLQAFDAEDAEEARAIQDAFESRVASEGIIRTAEEFCLVASDFKKKLISDEMDALLEDISREAESKRAVEKLPYGFHRGILADKRRRADYEEQRDNVTPYDLSYADQLKVSKSYREANALKVKELPDGSLRSCMMQLVRTDIVKLGNVLGLEGLSSRSKKEPLVDAVMPALLEHPELISISLRMASENAFKTTKRLVREGAFSFPAEEVLDNLNVQAMAPFTFLFYFKSRYYALIPDELKPTFAQISFESLERAREREETVVNFAASAAIFYGLVPLTEVYRQYAALYRDHHTEEVFRAILEDEIAANKMSIAIIGIGDVDYLAHYTLTNEYVTNQVVREHAARIRDELDYSEDDDGQTADPFELHAGEMTRDLDKELANLRDVQDGLIEQHAEIPVRPLRIEDVERDPIEVLWEQPSVLALCDFFDAHVPDWEDDLTFTDTLVDEILFAAIEIADLHGLLNYMAQMGMDRCTSDQAVLVQLITNVFNLVPSWENYGWSPKELMENITGRKIFYGPDGKVMKVGPEDPCPCGSGKKYRDCCGR